MLTYFINFGKIVVAAFQLHRMTLSFIFPCYSGMVGKPLNNPVLLNGPHLNTDGISERSLYCC